jgi:hypothetical protein
MAFFREPADEKSHSFQKINSAFPICKGFGDQPWTACCGIAAVTVGVGCEEQDEQNLLGNSPSNGVNGDWDGYSRLGDCLLATDR